MITSTTAPYEVLIRYDENGAFKGGHRIDMTRFADDAGGMVPPPIVTDAMPLTPEDLAAFVKKAGADALAGFSALKGQEIAQRLQIEDLERQLHEAALALLDVQDQCAARVRVLEAEIKRYRHTLGYDEAPEAAMGEAV